MRITVSLDSDTERMIRDAMQKRGVSFKAALNDAIRAGLAPAKRSRAPKFRQKTFSMGGEQFFRWDKALAVAEAIEDKGFSASRRTEECFRQRSSRAKIAKAKQILKRAGKGKPPVPGDEIC